MYLCFYARYLEDYFFVSNVLGVREFTPATDKCLTLTEDLEIQGHMIFYMTIPISATIPVRTTKFFGSYGYLVQGTQQNINKTQLEYVMLHVYLMLHRFTSHNLFMTCCQCI